MNKKIATILFFGIIIILFFAIGLYMFQSRKTSDLQKINLNPKSQTEMNSKNNELVEIILTDNGFSPKNININPGTKVIWINESGKEATVDSNPHPVHTSYQKLNLGMFKNGEKLELQFNNKGTYNYHNHFKPEDNGEIVVE